MISPILPWCTSAGDRAPVAASANRICTSRARTSRPLMRYTEPASRSIRREISSVSESFIAEGALRSELSIVITTSAWLRDGRLPDPAKITASMSAARSDLCDVSPIAQRSASTRLDLPQPFGPTTPVSPGSITKSVGSTKDLNPCRRRRVSFIMQMLVLAGRESLKADNTIEGVVMLTATHEPRLSGRDNGDAKLAGQRPRRALPESFAGFRRMFALTTHHFVPAKSGTHDCRFVLLPS